MNKRNPYSITILGSSGGVAKAILSIFNRSVQDKRDPLHHILMNAKFHLIDLYQQTIEYYTSLFPNLKDKLNLLQFDLGDVIQFYNHLKITNTKIVIDASWADTIEMLECCNKLGVYYINTALENTSVDEDEGLYGFPITERYLRFEAVKWNFTNTKAIIGSGMNPGIVQYMAIKLIKENPDDKPLACYFVEHDNSFYRNKKLIEPETIYASSSVDSFLIAAIFSYPILFRHHLPLYLYEYVYAAEYKVKLGSREFYGCLTPREEVFTLGKLYDMEIGFIYRVNEYTTELIQNNLSDVHKLWDWNQKIIDPSDGVVEGENLVGVLLVYNDHEKYVYHSTKSSEIFSEYQTNATYFQAACGVYAGLASLLLDPIPLGVYYVDELLICTMSGYEKYLTYYMKDFVMGENNDSDGLLHQRMKRIT